MKHSKAPLIFALLALGAAAAPCSFRKIEASGQVVVCYDPRDPRVPPLQKDQKIEKWIDKDTGEHCFALARGVQTQHPFVACQGYKADLYPDHIHCLAAGHVHANKWDSCEATRRARTERDEKAFETYGKFADTGIAKVEKRTTQQR
ncbi:hypothetical protein PpBr36_00237 [Pyricularia pennisetigena]|uniref:hypothetical protein n=1 Tax=Pyricularia pennisetigena TaxID=1578925 RepID=UPI0011540C8D|nr:hypothetical protein PpBr36_00237 [Pyricularia pennisetigena]TLS29526.1 hypothetical protein PpBr36_00237 [Pyricularia pennisetigena]